MWLVLFLHTASKSILYATKWLRIGVGQPTTGTKIQPLNVGVKNAYGIILAVGTVFWKPNKAYEIYFGWGLTVPHKN